MLIEISTEPHIDGQLSLIERIYAAVEASVGRHAHRVSRVAVYLGEVVDSPEVCCAIEVRLAGRARRGVRFRARCVDDAVAGAVLKLQRAVQHVAMAGAAT